MPGQNIVGACNAVTNVLKAIEKITVTADGTFACTNQQEGDPEDPAKIKHEVSASLSGGPFVWERVSAEFPNSIFSATRNEFSIFQTGCCNPNSLDTNFGGFGEYLGSVGNAHLTCLLLAEDGGTAFDDVFTAETVGNVIDILVQINSETDELECKIVVQVCSSTLSCLGECLLPCAAGASDWMPPLALIGSHVFTVEITSEFDEDGNGESSSFSGSVTVVLGGAEEEE
jgi:hypothetical protein